MVKDATSITEQVEKFYDKQASVDHAQVSWKKWELAASQYASYLKTPGKVLFPGCGRGEVIINLAKQKPSFEYYGIDLSKKKYRNCAKISKKSQC